MSNVKSTSIEKVTLANKIIKGIFLGALIIVVFFGFLFKPVKISGSAMSPNYREGETYLLNKMEYLFTEPKRGDVVTVLYNNLQGVKFIGRVIGLPDDNLMIKGGKVIVNGKDLQEIYLPIDAQTKTTNPAVGMKVSDEMGKLVETNDKKIINEGIEVIIPKDEYFILVDNRDNGYDSRGLGFVVKNNILGKLVFRYKL